MKFWLKDEGIIILSKWWFWFIVKVLCLYWKSQWFFFKWKYYNCLWTNSDGFYFSMKVLWYVFEKYSEILCHGIKVLLLQMMYFSYYFNIFATCFFFSPYPPTSLNLMNPFSNIHTTSILEGNGGKTQNLIIYKWTCTKCLVW